MGDLGSGTPSLWSRPAMSRFGSAGVNLRSPRVFWREGSALVPLPRPVLSDQISPPRSGARYRPPEAERSEAELGGSVSLEVGIVKFSPSCMALLCMHDAVR